MSPFCYPYGGVARDVGRGEVLANSCKFLQIPFMHLRACHLPVWNKGKPKLHHQIIGRPFTMEWAPESPISDFPANLQCFPPALIADRRCFVESKFFHTNEFRKTLCYLLRSLEFLKSACSVISQLIVLEFVVLVFFFPGFLELNNCNFNVPFGPFE